MTARAKRLPPGDGKRPELGPVERPILFSAPMVIATMRGRKTQTRRTRGLERFTERGQFIRMERDHRGVWCAVFGDSIPDDPCPIYVPSPYGGPGDRLWGRETFSTDALTVYPCPRAWYRADFTRYDDPKDEPHIKECNNGKRPWADCFACAREPGGFKWSPSIHMPRRLSRITLEVTSVRVERLQSISEADALAEGVSEDSPAPAVRRESSAWTARERFEALWESINGLQSWARNPWVWVVEFRRVTP